MKNRVMKQSLIMTLCVLNMSPLTQASSSPEPKPSLVLKAPLAQVPCSRIIKAADKAIAAKDQALVDANVVIDQEKKTIGDQDKVIEQRDKEASALGRNPFVMIGAGVASGALMAVNLVAPGLGLLGATILFTQVFKIF